MKNVKRIIFGIIFAILIGFLVYLFVNGVTIANSDYEKINIVFYILLLLVFSYYLLFYVMKPTYIKRFKIINTAIGLFVIYIGQHFLASSGIDGIYYGDIVCIIGVVLTIIGPTNALVSKDLEDSKKVEIIEA